MPLLFFVDNVICSGSHDLANNWNRLAYKRNVVTGDDEFGLMLDNALSEPESVSANERLAVFYSCLGLGFTGGNFEDPSLRQPRMTQIAQTDPLDDRIGRSGTITPQAYSYTLQDNLVPPPVGPVWKIGVALVGLVVVFAVLNGYAYRDAINELNKHVTNVQKIQETHQ